MVVKDFTLAGLYDAAPKRRQFGGGFLQGGILQKCRLSSFFMKDSSFIRLKHFVYRSEICGWYS
jgi:hypothetical protein